MDKGSAQSTKAAKRTLEFNPSTKIRSRNKEQIWSFCPSSASTGRLACVGSVLTFHGIGEAIRSANRVPLFVGFPSGKKMVDVVLSNPNFATPFLGRKLSGCRSIKKVRVSGASPRNPRCAVDVPFGGNVSRFPRVSIWDPYKRLGVSRDASEEEIWSARNFLLQQYVGHERSEESIEGAFEKILMASFQHRKKTKINLKTQLKKQVEESPPWVKNLLNFVELPPMDVIFRRLFLFAFMGGWSIMNSAEGGPAFQVAVSLAACIYFLNEKTKSVARASIIGFGALVTGWISGSILVPNIPTFLLNPAWSLELLTSLVVYLFLFLACAFLK